MVVLGFVLSAAIGVALGMLGSGRSVATGPTMTLGLNAHAVIATVAALAVLGSIAGARFAVRTRADGLRKLFCGFAVVMGGFVVGQELPRALGYSAAPSVALPWIIGTAAMVMVSVLAVIAVGSLPQRASPAHPAEEP